MSVDQRSSRSRDPARTGPRVRGRRARPRPRRDRPTAHGDRTVPGDPALLPADGARPGSCDGSSRRPWAATEPGRRRRRRWPRSSSRAIPSVALNLFSTGLGLAPLLRAGSPAQRAQFLPPFLATTGTPLASLALTEPGGTANLRRAPRYRDGGDSRPPPGPRRPLDPQRGEAMGLARDRVGRHRSRPDDRGLPRRRRAGPAALAGAAARSRSHPGPGGHRDPRAARPPRAPPPPLLPGGRAGAGPPTSWARSATGSASSEPPSAAR